MSVKSSDVVLVWHYEEILVAFVCECIIFNLKLISIALVIQLPNREEHDLHAYS